MCVCVCVVSSLHNDSRCVLRRQASDTNTAQVSQMKTMVKKLLKGKNEGQELRTTWQALLTGKGRWWLVGSAFAEVHFDKKPMKGKK